jgi:hypothetical protein
MSNEIYKLTVIELKQNIVQLGGKPHTKLNKNDLITYLSQLMNKTYGSNRITNDEYSTDYDIITDHNIITNDENIREKEGYYCKYHNGHDINDIKWKEELEDNGWTVIKIPGINSEYIHDEFWNLIYKYNKVNRDNRYNWNEINNEINGVLPYLSHEDIVWKIREQCKKVFTNIWNTDRLITSYDCPFFLSSHQKFKPLFYCNQSDFSYDFISVQGIYNITDTNINNGGLVIIEESNMLFEQYMKNNKEERQIDMNYINHKDELLLNQKWIKICAPKGTITLYDNRMFVCNSYPKDDNYTLGLYVSMQPREGATIEEIKKRIKLFERKKATTSWCYGPYFDEIYSAKKCKADLDFNLYKELIGYI